MLEGEDLLEPTPDVHALFVHYNSLYFEEALGPVSVQWSSKMTLCAGLCEVCDASAAL
jgi:hypothetical protein